MGDYLSDNWPWLLVGLAFAIALLAVGRATCLPFSLKPALWAISGVCFSESIRKRSLLVDSSGDDRCHRHHPVRAGEWMHKMRFWQTVKFASSLPAS